MLCRTEQGVDRARGVLRAAVRGGLLRLVLQVYLVTGDVEKAPDGVQDGFARAWLRWDTISRAGDDPVAWIYTVSYRIAVSRFRRRLAQQGPAAGPQPAGGRTGRARRRTRSPSGMPWPPCRPAARTAGRAGPALRRGTVRRCGGPDPPSEAGDGRGAALARTGGPAPVARRSADPADSSTGLVFPIMVSLA